MLSAATLDRRLLTQDVADFLYLEAELFDQHRLHEWLDLLTDDIRYIAPVQENLQGQPEDPYPELDYHLFDDDKASLTLRVRRLDTGLAHVETPASVTEHVIGNVRVLHAEGDEVRVSSKFWVYQAHDVDEVYFVGHRDDVLRGSPGSWKIARRTIHIARPVLPRAVSIFF